MMAASVPPTASRESSEFEFVSSSNPTTNHPEESAEKTSNEEKTEFGSEGIFGWVRGTGGGLLSKVAEKTKSSVETVITTLDPQMKDYIHSGGSLRVIVASDNHDKVTAVKEAFHSIFGQATVYGVRAQPKNVAAQPVGFAAAKQGASERIEIVRDQNPDAHEDGAVLVAVENFLLEAGDEEWVDIGCIMLVDKSKNIKICTYTQPTNVPYAAIQKLKEATGEDYSLSWSGFSSTIGSVMADRLHVHPSKWHEPASGVSRGVLLSTAALSLAYSYKIAIKAKVDTV